MVASFCRLLFFLVLFLPIQGVALFAQWSTSTLTQNALYVCPGFSPSIITFNDGSSIIAGGLTNDIFLGKLDERGYRIWPQPVLGHHNDSTNYPGVTARLIPDGGGGAIFVFPDNRRATPGPNGYYNNALYIQRVDGSGVVRWPSSGIQLAPANTGLKGARPVTDGAGGGVFIVLERDFDHPGATNIERLWGARYDLNGTLLWRRVYDSSIVQSSIQLFHVARIGARIYVVTMGGTLTLDLDGMPQTTPPYLSLSSLTSEDDSIGYSLKEIGQRIDSLGRRFIVEKLTKISGQGDSLWSSLFEIADEFPFGNSLVQNGLLPDGLGGVFFVWAYRDSSDLHRTRAQRIDSSGAHWPDGGLSIVQSVPPVPWAFEAQGTLGIYSQTNAQATKFDTSGAALWPQPFTVLSNPADAYFVKVGSDHRGGAILVFWTTLGGIFVQHTGRNGVVGIVTEVEPQRSEPVSFDLKQNYPNPFNPATTINYDLPVDAHVTMTVYDVLGKEVATLVDGFVEAGYHHAVLNAANLSSGVYFYRVHAGPYVDTKKLLLLR
jgi:hypothetical protein